MNSNTIEGTPIRVGKFVVGQVRGDTFYKTISGSKHFKIKPPGIANDISALQDIKAVGASWVNVTDRETGRVYRATIAMIEDKGIRFNQGFGNQINLLFQYWTTSLDMKSRALKAGEVRHEPAKKPQIHNEPSISKIPPAQLPLFG